MLRTHRWPLWLRALLASALVAVGLTAASSSVAQAANCGSEFWPTTGSATTYKSGTYYSITFKFKLTQAQLDALRCIAPYIELDFHMKNFNVPTGYPIGWDAYKLAGTNMPSAIHDVAFQDSTTEPAPAVTRVYTSRLNAGTEYYANLTWYADTVPGRTPSVTFIWVPSRWINSSLKEVTSCRGRLFGNNQYGPGDSRNKNEAWCIFPVDDQLDTILMGSKSYAGGFAKGEIPIYDGQVWYTFSPGAPPPATTPPPASNPPVVNGYHVTGTNRDCNNCNLGLKVRSGPGYTNYGQVGTLYDGNSISIICQTTGQTVSNGYASSPVWDKIVWGGGSAWVSDFYTDTPGVGAFLPNAARC